MKRTVLTAIAVVAFACLVWAQPGPGPAGGGPMGGPGMPMMEKAGRQGMPGMMAGIPDLTPEQMDKMDALRVSHMKTVLPIRTDIQVAEIELDALWRADKLDSKKIVAKVNEIGGLRQKLELAMVNHRIDMYNLMTPDQQKAMRKMHMGGGRGMMRGQGRGMGRGMKGGMKGAGAQGQMGQCAPQNCKDCMMH
ncbi:MAG: Spy/CpxP family protein refolding chaperone [candidate division WOR-3 bacterium]|nr:Spy/CpxP family protein refolding chaperone [candidate division WOR-3 bacterium]